MYNLLKKINKHIDENTEKATYQIIPFGILGFFTFPVFYFLVSENFPEQYENLPLRVLASLLCFPLMFKNYWPTRLKEYLPIYWYTVILYTLPFFFTFMLLKNGLSQVWLMNAMQLVFFLILIVDWLSFIILIILGSMLAFITFYINGGVFSSSSPFSGELISFIVAIFIGAVFSRSKSKLEAEKFEALQSFGATVAHELRTPLNAIQNGVAGVKVYLPGLIDTYKKAREASLSVDHIRADQLLGLEKCVNNIEAESNLANITINMLLTNVRQSKLAQSEITVFSASELIEQALVRYPMHTEQQNLIHVNHEHDFIIQGDKELLIHVFFNLLKNALYFIEATQKGDITIWFDSDETTHRIHFKDTGQGIAPSDLPHIFERFYTRRYHGTGIGLAFCKTAMHLHKGNIICRSILGEFAEFIISFPIRVQERT